MTYRDRREARAERLRAWADKRDARSAAAFNAAHVIADGIPFGQPILVGHHSERRARRDVDRIHNGMRAGIEHADKAAAMRSRADNIEHAADHAIYSDDPDAPERLRERIAELIATNDAHKAANVDYRKAHRAELAAMTPYARSQAVPWPSYDLTNRSGNVSRLRARLDAIEHPRPTWFHASRRDPDTCYKCDYSRADHTPHATVPGIEMCPTREG
jgi:Domain of unknown function (DUF3560)